MLDGTTEGIGLGQLAVFGDYTVAGRGVTTRVGVESVADPAGVAGAQGAGDLAVGSDIACWDLLDERIDLGEKIHS